MKFTNEQIKRWKAYEKVRASGIDPRARRAALLSEEDFTFVIKNYSGTFTNVAAAVAAGVTAAKFPRRIIHLSAGGTGAVPCIAISDGANWKQVAIGANAI